MIQSAIRVIKFALQNFFRNFWLSLATLTIIVITLILVNVIISINQIKISALNAIEQQIDISLDFKQNVQEAEVLKIRDDLSSDSRISSIQVVTPDQNLDHFKKRYPEIGDKVIPILDKNPLGYSLVIKSNNLNDYEPLLTQLDSRTDLKDKFTNTYFNDYRLFTSRASAISDRINNSAIALASIFFIIALIIVFNTIRVSIYTHRDEVGIMRLVGATNWFIRTPFIIESVMYSLMAIVILIAIVFGALHLLQPVLDRFFSEFASVNLIGYYQKNFLMVFGSQFLIIAFINGVSTAIALRRYLKI